MLQSFQSVWNAFEFIISSLPNEVLTVGAFSLCGILIVGFLRSL